MPTVTFFSAGGPSSGIQFDSFGAGDSYVGFFGPDGLADQILIGQAPDVSWITDSQGAGRSAGLSEEGQLNNHKWVDDSGVSISSGSRVDLSSVVNSGDATLRIRVTDTGNINISGARLYAFDNSDVGVDPSEVWAMSYEIISPSMPGTGDTLWALIDSTNYNEFVNRTPEIGYPASGEFNYFVGLSARPKLTSTSGNKNFGLYFRFDYS